MRCNFVEKRGYRPIIYGIVTIIAIILFMCLL
jgi:hypothetical protein